MNRGASRRCILTYVLDSKCKGVGWAHTPLRWQQSFLSSCGLPLFPTGHSFDTCPDPCHIGHSRMLPGGMQMRRTTTTATARSSLTGLTTFGSATRHLIVACTTHIASGLLVFLAHHCPCRLRPSRYSLPLRPFPHQGLRPLTHWELPRLPPPRQQQTNERPPDSRPPDSRPPVLMQAISSTPGGFVHHTGRAVCSVGMSCSRHPHSHRATRASCSQKQAQGPSKRKQVVAKS